jgi:hypothetical protein
MLARNLVAKWEAKLKREGLAPIDQVIGGRIVVRTQIITPMLPYVPSPDRLVHAIELWLSGDGSAFTAHGLALLARVPDQPKRDWPRRRARILLRVCRALADGKSINQACQRRGDTDLAYRYLRDLYRYLAEAPALGDDADGKHDGA